MVEKMYEVGEYQLELHEVQKAFVDWQRDHDKISMTNLKREIGYKDVSVKYLKGLIDGTQVLDKKHAPLFVDFLASKTRYKEVEKILESYVSGKPVKAAPADSDATKPASDGGDAGSKNIYERLTEGEKKAGVVLGAIFNDISKNEKSVKGLETRVDQVESKTANIPKDVAGKTYVGQQVKAAEKRVESKLKGLATQPVTEKALKNMDEAEELMRDLMKKLKIKY